MLVFLAGVGLAWASAMGWLPDWATNAPAYLGAAAFAAAAVVAYGAPGLLSGLERRAFGMRQIGAALLVLVLGVGLGAQALQVALAEWAVRPNGLPPAWPVVDGSAPGEFRILWLGDTRGERFPSPGGDPIARFGAGDASVRYSITDRHGALALDTGRGQAGDGYAYLEDTLGALIAGGSSHAGALLAPLGIRFVVAGPGDLPADVRSRLDEQVDLDRVPAGGLTIYRNAVSLPTAFVATDDGAVPPETGSLDEIAVRTNADVARIDPLGAASADLPVEGVVVASDQYEGAWRVVDGDDAAPVRPAFGWATSTTETVGPGPVSFEYGDQWIHTIAMYVLAAVWLAALWVTRKPGSA
jgi:hypothetical protein